MRGCWLWGLSDSGARPAFFERRGAGFESVEKSAVLRPTSTDAGTRRDAPATRMAILPGQVAPFGPTSAILWACRAVWPHTATLLERENRCPKGTKWLWSFALIRVLGPLRESAQRAPVGVDQRCGVHRR